MCFNVEKKKKSKKPVYTLCWGKTFQSQVSWLATLHQLMTVIVKLNFSYLKPQRQRAYIFTNSLESKVLFSGGEVLYFWHQWWDKSEAGNWVLYCCCLAVRQELPSGIIWNSWCDSLSYHQVLFETVGVTLWADYHSLKSV